jgi:hypothetical protein
MTQGLLGKQGIVERADPQSDGDQTWAVQDIGCLDLL